MSLNAIASLGAVGTVQPAQSSPLSHTHTQMPINPQTQDQAQTTAQDTTIAKQIATGMMNPLSPAMLAALVAETVLLRGSFSS